MPNLCNGCALNALFPTRTGKPLRYPSASEDPFLTRQHARQPFPNDAFSIRHDSVNELADSRNVIDESGHHSAAPGACRHIAIDHYFRIHAGNLLAQITDL